MEQKFKLSFAIFAFLFVLIGGYSAYHQHVIGSSAQHDAIIKELHHLRSVHSDYTSEYELFKALGFKHDTDKVTVHEYTGGYVKYLYRIRHKPLKFLEIGLGCGMHYGAGHSLHLWKEYLTDVDLYYFEHKSQCAQQFSKFLRSPNHMIVGDQFKREDLLSVLKQSGPLDVVVDDGGHHHRMQTTTLEALFPAVKPGGVYFLEDLHTSFIEQDFDGGYHRNDSTIERLHHIVRGLYVPAFVSAKEHPDGVDKLSSYVQNIDCYYKMCVLVRNAKPSILTGEFSD